MDINALKYKKSAGTLPVRDTENKSKKASVSVVHKESASISEIHNSAYRKDDASVSASIVFVLSGGEEREKNYFKPITKIKSIIVAFKSKEYQGLNPYQLNTIVEETLKTHRFETETQSYHFQKDDKLFVLQDLDEYEQDLYDILPAQKSPQVQWLISNPCFEIWLYYHYKDDAPQSMLVEMESITTDQRSKWLKAKLNDIIKGGADPTKALEHLPEAIERSRKYYIEKDSIPLLYATQMDKLGEHIIALDTNKEIENYFRAQKAKQEEWKAKIAKIQPLLKELSGKKIDDLIESLCVWDKDNPLYLPIYQSVDAIKGQTINDNRAFVASYKIEKAYLDDASNQIVGNTDDLFMMHILGDVRNYYFTQLVLHDPIKTYAIDYNHIEDATKKLGVNTSEYSVLTTMHLSQSIIPSYYIISGFDERIYIMHNDYVPLFSWKQYEGSNPDFKEIKEGSKIYSNFHQVKNYDDGYGIAVMRVGRFMLPPSGSFRMICLKLVGFNSEKSEIDKLSLRDTILLQYEEGDFILYQDIICEIEKIFDDGFIKLKYVDNKLSLKDIHPVPADGMHDKQIYYDPFIAATTIREGEPIPIHQKDYSYYMEHFKKEEWADEKQTTWDKVNECHFRYVHEIQHWLRSETSQDGLRIHWDEEMKLILKADNTEINDI